MNGPARMHDGGHHPETHRDRVVALATRVLGDRHEAEDVAQEVLLRVPPLGEPRSVAAWLSRACRRLAIDRLRARRRRARHEELGARAMASRSREASDEAIRALDNERLRACLAELDEPYRSAVELRYLEELEFVEVARRLGTIDRTARTWVARGLARLRAKLGGAVAVSMPLLFELLHFMSAEKKWWLGPLLVVLFFFSMVVVFAEGSAFAPFIYSLF